jgi:hypothetical protein
MRSAVIAGGQKHSQSQILTCERLLGFLMIDEGAVAASNGYYVRQEG